MSVTSETMWQLPDTFASYSTEMFLLIHPEIWSTDSATAGDLPTGIHRSVEPSQSRFQEAQLPMGTLLGTHLRLHAMTINSV